MGNRGRWLALAVIACAACSSGRGEGGDEPGSSSSAGSRARASTEDGSRAGSQAAAGPPSSAGASGSSAELDASGNGGLDASVAAGNAHDAGAASPPLGSGRSCRLGDRTVPDGALNIPVDCNTCTCNDGELSCTNAACAPLCVVARRLDQCCAPYKPVTLEELAGDECMFQYPAVLVDRARAERCIAKRGNCAAVTCPIDSAPPSRLAAPDAAGVCRFVDECQTAADCVLALAEGRCCECRSSVPSGLLEVNRCVVREGDAPANCLACGEPALCEQCAPAEPPTCAVGDALNRCQ